MSRKGKSLPKQIQQCAPLASSPGSLVPVPTGGNGPSNPKNEDAEARTKYWDCLIAADKEVVGLYGKTVVTLSGGALGVTMTLLKDVFSKRAITGSEYLVASWSCWTFSLFCVLFSYYSSHLALRTAMANFSAGKNPQDTFWDLVTKILNPSGAIVFLAGLVLFITFTAQNPF